MSNSDKWFFGFITPPRIVLTAVTPDVIDAVIVRLMGSQCTYDAYKGVKP